MIKTWGLNELKKFAIFKHTYCRNCQLGFSPKIKVPQLGLAWLGAFIARLEPENSNSLPLILTKKNISLQRNLQACCSLIELVGDGNLMMF